ncbi:MAG: hypothetical protein QXT63_04575 [Thermoplasmata archaeon]
MVGPRKQGLLTGKLESELELLQRHVNMLKTIKANQPIGIIRLSELLGQPQHKVRYSLRVLEQEGLIEPSLDGAVLTQKANEFFPQLKELLNQMNDLIKNITESLDK